MERGLQCPMHHSGFMTALGGCRRLRLRCSISRSDRSRARGEGFVPGKDGGPGAPRASLLGDYTEISSSRLGNRIEGLPRDCPLPRFHRKAHPPNARPPKIIHTVGEKAHRRGENEVDRAKGTLLALGAGGGQRRRQEGSAPAQPGPAPDPLPTVDLQASQKVSSVKRSIRLVLPTPREPIMMTCSLKSAGLGGCFLRRAWPPDSAGEPVPRPPPPPARLCSAEPGSMHAYGSRSARRPLLPPPAPRTRAPDSGAPSASDVRRGSAPGSASAHSRGPGGPWAPRCRCAAGRFSASASTPPPPPPGEEEGKQLLRSSGSSIPDEEGQEAQERGVRAGRPGRRPAWGRANAHPLSAGGPPVLRASAAADFSLLCLSFLVPFCSASTASSLPPLSSFSFPWALLSSLSLLYYPLFFFTPFPAFPEQYSPKTLCGLIAISPPNLLHSQNTYPDPGPQPTVLPGCSKSPSQASAFTPGQTGGLSRPTFPHTPTYW